MYIDSHCHLDLPELRNDIKEILDRMRLTRVNYALVVSLSRKTWKSMMDLVNSYENLWGSVGIHPCCQDSLELSTEELVQFAKNSKVVAIGETGLDYKSFESSSLDLQKSRFRKHIQAANQSGLPLIVHTRFSIEDSLRILGEELSKETTGVMHCFTENLYFAQKAIELNFFISISGIVTFKKASIVQELAKKVPLDRLLIETDSPFLSPEPYRGKINDPSNVSLIAKKIAQLREISVEEVAKASSDNFLKVFSKAKS